MFNPENIKVMINGVECKPFAVDESVVIPAKDAVIYPIVIPMTMKSINIRDVLRGNGLIDGFAITQVSQRFKYKKRYPKGIWNAKVDRLHIKYGRRKQEAAKGRAFMNYVEGAKPKNFGGV